MLCGDLIMTFVDESVMDVLRTRIMELEAEISVLKDITIKKQSYIMELERCMISFMEDNGPGISNIEAQKELEVIKSERNRDIEASRQLAKEYPEVFSNV
jgi:hypothetical protein